MNLARKNLVDIDLSHAELRGANLRGADVSNAILHAAKLAHATLATGNFFRTVFSYADLEDANLEEADLSSASLDSSILEGANLKGANLAGADMESAELKEANFDKANLICASLCRAYFGLTELNGADLCHADLSEARLWFSHLAGANLCGANLTRADLYGSSFGGAVLGETVLIDLDITPLCDAEPPLAHEGVSVIDFRTVAKSLHSPNLKTFLQRAGMSEIVAEYSVECARSLSSNVFAMFQSAFISYGAPDEPFARRLHEALHRNGVKTFYFPMHSVPGEKLHRVMRTAINEHDRVILICSRASLKRKGVLNEIEETLAREARDGGATYLIPIRIDDYIFSAWAPSNPDVAQALRDRVVVDFVGADSEHRKFDTALLRLLAALSKR